MKNVFSYALCVLMVGSLTATKEEAIPFAFDISRPPVEYVRHNQSKNPYYEEINTLKTVASFSDEVVPFADENDVIIRTVFRRSVPSRTPIIELHKEDAPHLFQKIELLALEIDIPLPRIYFAPDTRNIDVSYVVLDDTASALLFHSATFSAFTLPNFEAYLKLLVNHLHVHMRHYQEEKHALNVFKQRVVGVPLLLFASFFLFNKLIKPGVLSSYVPKGKWFSTLLGLGSGAGLYHLLQKKNRQISYGRYISLHALEQARQDELTMRGDAHESDFISRALKSIDDYIKKQDDMHQLHEEEENL